jgi:exosortase J
MYAPVVAGAVLLGYVFNFLRLCLLVIYYKIAVPYPWLHHHAKRADYLIGGGLFMAALAVFFTVANKLRRDLPEDGGAVFPAGGSSIAAGPYLAKVAAVLVLSAVFGFDAMHTHFAEAKAFGRPPMMVPMPSKIGDYTLVRTWNDTLVGGTIVYTWGEYAEGGQGTRISLGISPVFGVHDAEVCHIARGEDPTWHGQIAALSPAGRVDLTAAAYNDGTRQWLEASTVCDNGVCRQFSRTSEHVTLVFSYPHKGLPMQEDTNRPVPILLKVETHDTAAPVTTVVPELGEIAARFLKNADLLKLTAPYSKH